MTTINESTIENGTEIDPSYFFQLIGKLNEELQQPIEEKKAKIKALEQEHRGKKQELLEIVEEKNELDKKALDERIDFKMLTEGCEKFNQHLIQLQSEYNKIVDPFNNARKSMGQNKEKYQIVAKLYNDRNRKIEDRKNQLHQKVVAMGWKIKDVHGKIAQKQQSLESAKEVRDKKIENLNQSRERGQTAAIEWNSINVDELNQQMDNSKIVQEQEKFEIEELRNFIEQTEEAIHDLDEQIIQNHNLMKTLQDVIAEGTAANDIKEQRLNNEKQIAEQVLQTKFNRHCQRIEDANMNIAKELLVTLKKTAQAERLIEDMKVEMQEKIENVQSLMFQRDEKVQVKEQIADQIAKAPAANLELQDKKNGLIKTISDIMKEKQEQIQDFEKTAKNYGAKTKKELRRQTVVGVIEDENSSVVSIDELKSISEMSSSMSESNVKAEKIDFEMSTILDTSGGTNSSKKRQKK